MNQVLQDAIKKVIPASVLDLRRRALRKRELRSRDEEFRGKSPKYIFSKIYDKKMWGGDGFCSGHGSHDKGHVAPYVRSVSAFLDEFTQPINVVDLGCGDFIVGSQIRSHAAQYVACDVVPHLITRNKEIFADLNVDFRVVDMTKDDLPQGDVLIIRQVLQHLSNIDIMKVVGKLEQYQYLVLTEHLPMGDFEPNIDQSTGSFSRIARGVLSGVVLTAYPFNLKIKSERVICETPEQEGTLKVIVYEL